MDQHFFSSDSTDTAIKAIYQSGCLVLCSPLALPEGTPVRLRIWTLQSPPGAPEQEIRTVTAIYQDNILRLPAPLDLPDQTVIWLEMALQVTMVALVRPPPVNEHPLAIAEPSPTASPLAVEKPLQPSFVPGKNRAQAVPARERLRSLWSGQLLPLWQKGWAVLAKLTRQDALLLGSVMLVYLLVRVIGLTSFPIYFFSDEAIHANQGLAIIQNGFRDEKGVFLPPYFRNVQKWNLSLSVYLQGVSAFLFGKSVLVTRLTSVAATLLAGIALALMLKKVFRLRSWWIGPLVLSAIPVWFLHSRTGFETVLMVSFYACFLCSYLLYRYSDPRFLIAAIVFGAATFYSYTNGQGVMLVSGLLLLLSDLRYHLRILRERRLLVILALTVLVVVIVPYLRFRWLYPDAMEEHLRNMNSILVENIPLAEKFRTYFQLYSIGISPKFWFAPNNGIDLSRHTFKDWGNIPYILLPMALLGLLICLRGIRESSHRAVIIAILAAPFSAALAEVHNYRVLAMVIPAAILISLGMDWLANSLSRGRLKEKIPTYVLPLGFAIWFVAMNFTLLRTAIVDGPTWYGDYGLYGMQYGASQVFTAVADELRQPQNVQVVISPDWANNPDEFASFFLPKEMRSQVTFLSPVEYLTWKHDLPQNTLYVLPADAYEKLRSSEKMVVDAPVRSLPYPDGRPGFYFVRMRYSDQIDAILAAEREARSKLIEESASIDGEKVQIKHSLLDLGSMPDLFDNDTHTLIRGFEANPLVLEIEFSQPHKIEEIDLGYWRVNLQLMVKVVPADQEEPQTYTAVFRESTAYPSIQYKLPNGPVLARSLRLELLNIDAKDVAKIHVYRLHLR